MISRSDVEGHVLQALSHQAAVALIGPRQVGKTTLARQIADSRPGSIYLDLEAREDRDKLAEPVLFLRQYEQRLVVLDEIHRVPELFSSLRGLIDQGRRSGVGVGRFLVLGSASMDLLRQSGESLAECFALGCELTGELTHGHPVCGPAERSPAAPTSGAVSPQHRQTAGEVAQGLREG